MEITEVYWKHLPGGVLRADGLWEVGGKARDLYYIRRGGEVMDIPTEALFQDGQDGVEIRLRPGMEFQTIDGPRAATQQELGEIRLTLQHAMPFLGRFVRFG